MNIAICTRSSEAADVLNLPGSMIDLVLYQGERQVVILTRLDFIPQKLLMVRGVWKARLGFHPSHLPAYLIRGHTPQEVSRKLQRHFAAPMVTTEPGGGLK